MNVVLVVSDTFRRDHLGCYGNQAIRTPNLDAFARHSLVFEDCYPTSFPTVPARADLMTGRYTFLYLPWGPLPENEITLAECLREAGYTTAGVGDTPFIMRNGYGYDRGFSEFIYVRGQLHGTEREYRHAWRHVSEAEGYCAAKTLQEAAHWLERHHRKQPFFLYVDTWDPHEPWDPPDYYVRPYLPDYKGEVIHPNYWEYRADGYTERDLEIAHACYCGEISMVDHWFGYLMERLRVLNLLQDTAVFFTSDHGFYFGEHGIFGKRRFRWPDGSAFEEGFAKGLTVAQRIVYRSPLHNEITRVPLLMYLPGQEARRIAGLVTLPDLMPTILELAGVDVPQRVEAPSILPLLRGEKERLHDIVVTSAPFEEKGTISRTVDDQEREVMEVSPSSITDGQWDLLYSMRGHPVELYQRTEDEGHKRNLIANHRAQAEQVLQKYVAWLEARGVPQEVIEARRAL